jgi:hypothetical protein
MTPCFYGIIPSVVGEYLEIMKIWQVKSICPVCPYPRTYLFPPTITATPYCACVFEFI